MITPITSRVNSITCCWLTAPSYHQGTCQIYGLEDDVIRVVLLFGLSGIVVFIVVLRSRLELLLCVDVLLLTTLGCGLLVIKWFSFKLVWCVVCALLVSWSSCETLFGGVAVIFISCASFGKVSVLVCNPAEVLCSVAEEVVTAEGSILPWCLVESSCLFSSLSFELRRAITSDKSFVVDGTIVWFALFGWAVPLSDGISSTNDRAVKLLASVEFSECWSSIPPILESAGVTSELFNNSLYFGVVPPCFIEECFKTTASNCAVVVYQFSSPFFGATVLVETWFSTFDVSWFESTSFTLMWTSYLKSVQVSGYQIDPRAQYLTTTKYKRSGLTHIQNSSRTLDLIELIGKYVNWPLNLRISWRA